MQCACVWQFETSISRSAICNIFDVQEVSQQIRSKNAIYVHALSNRVQARKEIFEITYKIRMHECVCSAEIWQAWPLLQLRPEIGENSVDV